MGEVKPRIENPGPRPEVFLTEVICVWTEKSPLAPLTDGGRSAYSSRFYESQVSVHRSGSHRMVVISVRQ